MKKFLSWLLARGRVADMEMKVIGHVPRSAEMVSPG